MELSVHVDFYDQVYGEGGAYGLDAWRGMCRRAKDAGVSSLNFRVEGAGMAWVPNAVRPMFDHVDKGAVLDWADFSRIINNHPFEAREEVAEWFKRTYEVTADPLAAAVEAARAEGIGINVYVCPYDQFWPYVPGTYVAEHPEHCIGSRDGKSRIAVPSLAYDGFLDWLLAYYDTILEHDVDDVVVYTGSHSWYSYPLDVADDWFGFEGPAAEGYREKTGIDVRKDEFDVEDYYRHYGGYWTRFLKALSDRQQSRGKRLIVGMDLGDWQVYVPWAAGRLMTTWRHYNDWREWTSWGNVDLCVGHQGNIWEYEGSPINKMAFMPGEVDKPPYRWARGHFGEADERDFKLYSFLTLHADKADFEIPLAFGGTSEEGFDGMVVREAADFEYKLSWDRLAQGC